MSKISFTRKVDVASIQKRSNNILKIFTQVQTDCENLNAEIAEVAEEKRQKTKILLDEIKELEAVAEKNSNLSKKIESFLKS